MKPYITNRAKGINIYTLSEFIDRLYQEDKVKISILEAQVIIQNIISSLSLTHFKKIDNEITKSITTHIINTKRNQLPFKYEKDKNRDLSMILDEYNRFLSKHNLADISDIETSVLNYLKNHKIEVFADEFENDNISFFTSKLQKQIFNQLHKTLKTKKYSNTPIQYIIKSYNKYEEVANALKILKDLDSKNVLIITTNIDEYYPIFEALFNEYNIDGYSTKGIKKKHLNISIHQELNSTIAKFKKFNLSFNKNELKKELLESRIIIQNSGVTITETNQIYSYNEIENIIFIGTDNINFPPTRDKHLFYYKGYEKDFSLNNLYLSSVDIYQNIKNRAKKLYIIYSEYDKKTKKELSFIIDKNLIPYTPKYKSKLDYFKENREIKDNHNYHITNKEIKIKHLSASQINTYQKCPKQYFYKYILSLKPPKEKTDEMEVSLQGSIMHKVFEFMIKEPNNANRYYIDKAYQDEKIKPYLKGDIFEKIYEIKLNQYIDKFREYQKSLVGDIKVEQEFYLDEHLEISDENNYFIKGIIDRIDENEEITIIDYKSKKIDKLDNKKIKETQELKDVQLGLYLYWVKKNYNKPATAHLLSFNNKNYIHFTTIKDRNCDKQEICYDEEYEKTLKNIIFTTKENIENHKFPKNPDEEVCKWCDYQSLCRN